MPISALVTDLIFATKISSTARAIGVEVKIVRTLEKLRERLAGATDHAIIVDLSADGVDALEAIAEIHVAGHRPRTIAYASHVEADLIAAARQAGADQVMARSAFADKLPAILTSLDKARGRSA